MPFELRTWVGLAVVAAMGSVGWAQSAPEPSVEAPSEATRSDPPAAPGFVRHRCRLFPTELDATVDTWDRSTALGQWVLGQQEAGFRVDDVEMSVGRKATGFVQAYTQVCMVPLQKAE